MAALARDSQSGSALSQDALKTIKNCILTEQVKQECNYYLSIFDLSSLNINLRVL